jgi:hypothetical protein
MSYTDCITIAAHHAFESAWDIPTSLWGNTIVSEAAMLAGLDSPATGPYAANLGTTRATQHPGTRCHPRHHSGRPPCRLTSDHIHFALIYPYQRGECVSG